MRISDWSSDVCSSDLGVKGGRATYCGKHDVILTVGFGKSAQREYSIWDPKNMSEPLLAPTTIDNSSGVLAPFYDEDSDIVFLAGKVRSAPNAHRRNEIGRASCRERVCQYV